MEDTNKLTKEGLRQYEDELHDLKVNRRQEIAQKIKEAREQGDLSENAEYDAAKDEQRDIEARIEEIARSRIVLPSSRNSLRTPRSSPEPSLRSRTWRAATPSSTRL